MAAYPIEKKLVVAVSSSALFDMAESDAIFRADGEEKYRQYQWEKIDTPLEKGVAFPFIKRLLLLNESFPKEKPVEVVLFSRNSPETGLRAFRSIQHHQLDITRAYFSSGKPTHHYLPAFNSSLFLSSNLDDVTLALKNGSAAGVILQQTIDDRDESKELRMGFDFDGVIADDSSERVHSAKGLDGFHTHEEVLRDTPLSVGPMAALLKRISHLQELEELKMERDSSYRRILKTAIITARSAPAHERVVTTLTRHNIKVDEIFFLGGIEKASVLKIFRPHIFFDDQRIHLEHLENIPAVHIPFGIKNLR